MLLNLLGASKRVVMNGVRVIARSTGARAAAPRARSAAVLTLAIIFGTAAITGCSGSNFFETFASTDSDESMYRTALDAINDGDFQAAIDTCELMTTEQASTDRGLYICANAYAGFCGYSLFTVAEQLSTYAGPELLFEYFMEQNNGATSAKKVACNDALTRIRAIGTAANRTDDHNYLAILSGLTNMGVILNLYADASTNDDGAPDVGWDACDSAVDLPDADAIQFGKALWEIHRSVEATASTLTDPIKTTLDAVSSGIDAIDATYNFLDATANPASFTANEIKGVRTLIKEGAVLGLNYCANFAVCMCP